MSHHERMPPRKKAARPLTRSVLIIGSEALPFAKTGGLADVLGALPVALGRLGWDVTLALPRYRGVSAGERVDAFPVTVGSVTRDVSFYSAPLSDRANALLIDCPELYDRDALYGTAAAEYPDNARRFGMLARAALEFAGRPPSPRRSGDGAKAGSGAARPFDVVHAHDWQAGLAPVYLKSIYATHPVLAGMPSVFTIHNLAYQGLFPPDWLPRLDLPGQLFSMAQLEFWGRISFLKGGINHAELVSTVSPRYAEEVQTPEFGSGFDGILRARSDRLSGILNGINTDVWDPAHDPFLPAPYDAKDLTGKGASKAAVLARFGLGADGSGAARPLIGMISRMVDQKGLDLIAMLAEDLPRLGATFVVLGTGEERYEQLWKRMAAAHPDRIGVYVGFNEGLAHLIEAGSDMFLMPSRFEPCGLNQMYSLRYGTVPIVRAVGGLADTVHDAHPFPGPGSGGASARQARPNGFVFHDYSPAALLEALNRALGGFADREAWRALQLAGMAEDHSWDRSAREYVKMYERAITMRAPAM